MKSIKKLNDLLEPLQNTQTPRVAVAVAQEEDTIIALNRAINKNIVEVILVGNKDEITSIIRENKINISDFEIIPEKDEIKATQKAVSLVKENKADILMRGLGKTQIYLKSILN